MPRSLAATPFLIAAATAFAPADGRGAGPDAVFAPLLAESADLERHRWTHRPVLLFAPAPDHPAYRKQHAALAAAADGLRERDIVVLSDVDPAAGGAHRQALGARGFEVLLIGKDGGVKLRRQQPITAEALFAAIDAMPMRRREMSQ